MWVPAVDKHGQPLTVAVDWRLPDNRDNHAPLLARCRAVGPAVIDALPAADIVPGASATAVLTIATWNTHVGGGDVRAFVAALRSGALTSGEPVRALRAVPPGSVPARDGHPADRSRRRGRRQAPRRIAALGPREDVVSAAASLGLALSYVPSTRNGADDVEDRGNAILSTLPLSGFAAVELPFGRYRRVAVAATIDGAGGPGSVSPARI